MDGNDGFDREKRRRSVALALVLGGVALLVFVMSIVKWGTLVPH
jgi:hypothetical protein